LNGRLLAFAKDSRAVAICSSDTVSDGYARCWNSASAADAGPSWSSAYPWTVCSYCEIRRGNSPLPATGALGAARDPTTVATTIAVLMVRNTPAATARRFGRNIPAPLFVRLRIREAAAARPAVLPSPSRTAHWPTVAAVRPADSVSRIGSSTHERADPTTAWKTR
jgi:hypothetical protein